MFDNKTFLLRYSNRIDAILELLENMSVGAREGENILLWCAGLSIGARSGSIKGEPLEVLAKAFLLGASKG